MALSQQDLSRQVLANVYVLTVGTNDPPAAPAFDDRHVVGTAPTGAWALFANAIARWNGAAWVFSVPTAADNWGVYNKAEYNYYGWTGAAWVAVTAPASPVWMPLLAPAVPGALDDEFTAAVLDTSIWDIASPGGNFAVNGGGGAGTLDTTEQMLRVLSTGNGSDRLGWISRSLGGATEGVIYSAVFQEVDADDSNEGGIIFGDDTLITDPTTAELNTIGQYIASPVSIGAAGSFWGDYQTFLADTGSFANPVFTFFRLRFNGSDIEGDCSADGIEWIHIVSDTIGTALTRVGLYFNVTVAGATFVARFPFFRVVTGAGMSDPHATRLGRLGLVITA